MHKMSQTLQCAADTSITGEHLITSSGYIPPSYIQFGEIKICCKTGEVTGLSENISEDAKLFWKEVKEQVIGK